MDKSVEEMSLAEKEAFVRDYVKKSLDRHLRTGLSPESVDSLKKGILEAIEGLKDRKLLSNPTDDELNALTSIILIDWVGLGEDFDPKAILARISESTLHQFADCYRWESLDEGPFAVKLLLLESRRRLGVLTDWTFERVDESTANLTYTFAQPLRRLVGTYTVNV